MSMEYRLIDHEWRPPGLRRGEGSRNTLLNRESIMLIVSKMAARVTAEHPGLSQERTGSHFENL